MYWHFEIFSEQPSPHQCKAHFEASVYCQELWLCLLHCCKPNVVLLVFFCAQFTTIDKQVLEFDCDLVTFSKIYGHPKRNKYLWRSQEFTYVSSGGQELITSPRTQLSTHFYIHPLCLPRRLFCLPVWTTHEASITRIMKYWHGQAIIMVNVIIHMSSEKPFE